VLPNEILSLLRERQRQRRSELASALVKLKLRYQHLLADRRGK
jgi:hypothetical protein